MGISRLTCMLIAATTEAELKSVITQEGGKFGFIIMHPSHPGMQLVSTTLHWNSEEEAKESLDELVKDIRKQFSRSSHDAG